MATRDGDATAASLHRTAMQDALAMGADYQSVRVGGSVPILYTDGYVLGYADGYIDGERFGFSSPREDDMEPIKPGETDPDKKVVDFYVYTSSGLPASGAVGEGAVFVPGASDVQVNHNLAGFVNGAGTFSQVGDHKYRYTFHDDEVAAVGGEGNVWVRVKQSGYRTVLKRVPLRYIAVDSIAASAAATLRDAVLDALLSDHAIAGSVADGIAIAAGLLQGNFFMDNTTHDANGQTSGRLRLWRSAAAMGTPTPGAAGLEGAFAAFTVTTTYSGVNKVATHSVVRTT